MGVEGWGRYGARPIWLLSGVAFIDSVDRGILPGVLTRVQDDLDFGDTAAGLLGTAFILTGFLVMIPAGYLADRFRRTRIIAVVLVSWGAISALNATVRNYGQFLAVRASLGVGETVDNPASQSLIADYYPPASRGRAYALQRVAPIAGTAVGTGLGGLVGAVFGWRWAFLLVGVPGSLLAVAMWRLPEPRRGESDGGGNGGDGDAAPGAEHAIGSGVDLLGADGEPEALLPSSPPAVSPGEVARRRLGDDIRAVVRVRTLRALIVGSAITGGALTGLAFWAPAFYERHTSIGGGAAAGVTSALILVGALGGMWAGGVVTDRFRDRVQGAPMLIAGGAQALGAVVLMTTFVPMPLWYRSPVQIVGVALVVAGLPALAAMTAEVVPAAIRGLAFSVTSFLSALANAVSPLLIGFVAERFAITVDGEEVGHIANAFLVVSPLLIVGGIVVLRGRRHLAHDAANVGAVAPAAP